MRSWSKRLMLTFICWSVYIPKPNIGGSTFSLLLHSRLLLFTFKMVYVWVIVECIWGCMCLWVLRIACIRKFPYINTISFPVVKETGLEVQFTPHEEILHKNTTGGSLHFFVFVAHIMTLLLECSICNNTVFIQANTAIAPVCCTIWRLHIQAIHQIRKDTLVLPIHAN